MFFFEATTCPQFQLYTNILHNYLFAAKRRLWALQNRVSICRERLERVQNYRPYLPRRPYDTRSTSPVCEFSQPNRQLEERKKNKWKWIKCAVPLCSEMGQRKLSRIRFWMVNLDNYLLPVDIHLIPVLIALHLVYL